MSQQEMPAGQTGGTFDFERETNLAVDVAEVHVNTSQNVIYITEDRVRIHLITHLQRVEKKRSWVTPLMLLVTIIVVLLTSQFRDLVLSAATWKAMFVMASLVSVVWLVYALKNARRSETIDELIERLKKDSK